MRFGGQNYALSLPWVCGPEALAEFLNWFRARQAYPLPSSADTRQNPKRHGLPFGREKQCRQVGNKAGM